MATKRRRKVQPKPKPNLKLKPKPKGKVVVRATASSSHRFWLLSALVIVCIAAYLVGRYDTSSPVVQATPTPGVHTPAPTPQSLGGHLLTSTTPQILDPTQIEGQVKWRYGTQTPTPHYSVAYQLIEYTSTDETGAQIDEYARVYIPVGLTDPTVIDFAPGTTGIGEACASSLEQPLVHNWGDYNAHYLAYASQGMIVVATDYQGMRQPGQMHYYMVGQLEGRAMLDAELGASQLPGFNQVPSQKIFLAGYSQGGQAAFWADQIDHSYAPTVKLAGLVAFAPVSSVLQTWEGVVHGASLDWFGPYVLTSYSAYYDQDLGVDQILLPKWQTNLVADATSHCIDTAPSFYGSNPNLVYTPQFLAALTDGNLEAHGYGVLADELADNEITESTSTPKLLIQGLADTTILPTQTAGMVTKLCQLGSGRVHEETFAKSTHYTIIPDSFTASLDWIESVKKGETPPTDCAASDST